ncbi:MAG: FAD:protein FMN transferase [Treponema sp.]|jgi:thiamine biosynthesis lipoprotein|nr:FAD:protein FMN transferase [Treponema sp.]
MKKLERPGTLPLACLLWCLFSAACAKAPPARMEFALGTVCTINLYEYGSEALYTRVFSRIREIDRTMRTGSSGLQEPPGGMAVSEVARINRNAGAAPVKVSAGLIDVLERSLYYAELSGGAFDPTIGPLVRLWGIGTDAERIPEKQESEEALALVNWRDLAIDREAGTVFLKRQGMALDLGAIAKGYAADEAARLAAEGGVKRAIFDLGGNILALGSRSETEAWRVGVQDPLGGRGAYIGVLSVRDKSIVTSGVYERFFESGGRRYHHILSTADGYPVEKGLLSVTITAPASIDADGLSTSVFALGYEKGRALAESLPGIEAIFILEDLSVRITGGLEGNFEIRDEKYKLVRGE